MKPNQREPKGEKAMNTVNSDDKEEIRDFIKLIQQLNDT